MVRTIGVIVSLFLVGACSGTTVVEVTHYQKTQSLPPGYFSDEEKYARMERLGKVRLLSWNEVHQGSTFGTASRLACAELPRRFTCREAFEAGVLRVIAVPERKVTCFAGQRADEKVFKVRLRPFLFAGVVAPVYVDYGSTGCPYSRWQNR